MMSRSGSAMIWFPWILIKQLWNLPKWNNNQIPKFLEKPMSVLEPITYLYVKQKCENQLLVRQQNLVEIGISIKPHWSGYSDLEPDPHWVTYSTVKARFGSPMKQIRIRSNGGKEGNGMVLGRERTLKREDHRKKKNGSMQLKHRCLRFHRTRTCMGNK